VSSNRVRESSVDAPPLSIVHLCAPAHVGGLERVVQGLAGEQRRQGHAVRVVAVVEPGAEVSAFIDPLLADDVFVEVLVLPGRAYLREIRLIRRKLAEWGPDVLHTHGYRPDLLHGWSARSRGIATVSTLHGSSRMGGASALFEWIQERALGRFDAVVAVSLPLVEALQARGVPRSRIHVVPNAWTPPTESLDRPAARDLLGVADDRRVLGWVGRLIPIKGADVLLDALALLRSDGWHACIVGDGPERAELEARADDLGLGDRVSFLGAIPDAARLLAGLDLFVISSRSEGTPMVLLEAMGAGVPVVSTDVGGIPDVLRPPDEGWLAPPETPGALAAAIDEALADPDRRAAVASAGRVRIESEFDQAAWVARHDEVYRSAMAVAGGTPPDRSG
jgi:glycosyltransferase involved in cell wall biosynthesis